MNLLTRTPSVANELAEHFAELGCASSILANQILERFPQYREAKGDPRSAFWREQAQQMLYTVIEAELTVVNVEIIHTTH
jgi:hypothetical protein